MFEKLAAELATLPADAQRERLRTACQNVTLASGAAVKCLLAEFAEHERFICQTLAARMAADDEAYQVRGILVDVLRRQRDVWQPLLCQQQVLADAALWGLGEHAQLCIECGADPRLVDIEREHSEELTDIPQLLSFGFVDRLVQLCIDQPDDSASNAAQLITLFSLEGELLKRVRVLNAITAKLNI